MTRLQRAGRTRQGLTALAVGAALIAGGHTAIASASPRAWVSAVDDPSALTWALGPVNKDGENRALFQYNVNPGDVISDAVSLKVIGSSPISFDVYGSDAFLGETGGFDVLPAAKPSRDVGSWVELKQDQLKVNGEDTVEIPFQITVPDNAIPGDHVGGIVTSVSSDVRTDDSGTVRLDRRLGTRIYLRVAGALAPSVQIGSPTVKYKASGNPVAGGRTEVTYTMTNTGNTRVQARRAVEVGGLIGGTLKTKNLPELLPGSALTFTDSLSGPRFPGPLTATVKIEPRLQLEGELPTSSFTAASASASAWALPWMQLGALFVLILIVSGATAARRRAAASAEEPISSTTSEPESAPRR